MLITADDVISDALSDTVNDDVSVPFDRTNIRLRFGHYRHAQMPNCHNETTTCHIKTPPRDSTNCLNFNKAFTKITEDVTKDKPRRSNSVEIDFGGANYASTQRDF